MKAELVAWAQAIRLLVIALCFAFIAGCVVGTFFMAARWVAAF